MTTGVKRHLLLKRVKCWETTKKDKQGTQNEKGANQHKKAEYIQTQKHMLAPLA